MSAERSQSIIGHGRAVDFVIRAKRTLHNIQRFMLATVFDLKPPRLWSAPRLVYRLVRHLLRDSHARMQLPAPTDALPGREGVAGYCDDMSVANLRRAYAVGLYPCTHFGPVRWNAPPLRAVLDIREFRIRDELRRKLRKRPFGTAVGPVFTVESLFHTRDNSSKYALTVLIGHLQAWGFTHVDNKLQNPHCEAMGFRELDRDKYLELLIAATPHQVKQKRWFYDSSLDLARWKPAVGPPSHFVDGK